MRSGAVWSRNHTQLDAPIDGDERYLFLVLDLASGKVLTALPARSNDYIPILAELKRVLALQGPPLVLKMDDGSAFVQQDVQK